MKKILVCMALAGSLLGGCNSNNTQEKTKKGTEQTNSVAREVQINASATRVWQVLTDVQYAKVLGNEFDKNSFMESDWKLGSQVHFKYEPDTTVASGTITKLIKEELIQIDYDFDGYAYCEKFILKKTENGSLLIISAGPYAEDLEAQKTVWENWLRKVKEISEER